MDIQAILKYYQLIPEDTDEKEINFCCPFHGEQNPSLSFSVEKNLFHCFTCDLSGDILDIIMCMENIPTEKQAVTRMLSILRRSGKHPMMTPAHATQDEERRETQKIRRRAFEFYTQLPAIDWFKVATSYLLARGFTPEVLKACGVKYNVNSIYAIVLHLVEQGKFHGYVTRRIDQVKNRKYLNNKGYPRSEILVGNLKKGPVLVVEGMLDRMKAIQYGYTNTTALLNWKISLAQTKKLAVIASEVICALDNDERGEKGYLYLCSVLRPYGIAVRRFAFPAHKKDVCELTEVEFNDGFKANFQINTKLVGKTG